MKYILAIDLGTTNWKVVIYNSEGTLIDILRTPTITHRDSAGNSFYIPSELWECTSKLCREILNKNNVEISAVSVTSVAESVVGVDKNGNDVGDIIAWFDSRAIEQIDEIKEHFSDEEIYRITGLDMNPVFSLPKILWIRKNRPIEYEGAIKWLQIADYINFKLSGEFVTDYTLASRTLAFDLAEKDWSTKILAAVKVPISIMPAIVESGTVIGRISSKISRQTGITEGATVVVAGHDHPCASLATSVLTENSILDSSGTAESFINVTKPNQDICIEYSGQRTCRFLEKNRYALWGGIISSGRSFDWAMATYAPQNQERDTVLKRVSETKGMAAGLLYYPHLRGSGAPYWNPRARGAFLGISDQFCGDNFIRSVIEGLCMQARVIVEMEQRITGCDAKRVCVVGGSSNNLLWQSIKADVLQKEIELSDNPEATSFGAAMLGAIGIGEYSGIDEVSQLMCRDNRVIYPDFGMKDFYDELYYKYCMAYEHIQKVDMILTTKRDNSKCLK